MEANSRFFVTVQVLSSFFLVVFILHRVGDELWSQVTSGGAQVVALVCLTQRNKLR